MSQDTPQPASESNRARQARSRLNITHPVRWQNDSLEQTYNIDRTHSNKSDALKQLHRRDDHTDSHESDRTIAPAD